MKLKNDRLQSLNLSDIGGKLLDYKDVTSGDLKQFQTKVSSYLSDEQKIQSARDTFQAAARELASSFRYLSNSTREALQKAQDEYNKQSLLHADWATAINKPCTPDGKKAASCEEIKYQTEANQLDSILNKSPDDQKLKEASSNAVLSARLDSSIFNIEVIADAAHKAINAFAKPDDVACAMTILSWNNMRYTFGQKVADEFLGVQITVRNLNGEKEFLLHGADLAVDMDFSGSGPFAKDDSDAKQHSPQYPPLHSRFFSGVDKQNVRAYMLAARDYDTRSLVVHTAESLSTLIGSVAPIWGGAVTDASSVFAGGFLPALTHVYTDSHTEQLNELNDVGFSASRNDRTFVPKSGSTQFVIFVPVRPLEQAWWTQKCVEAIPLGRSGTLTSPTGLDIEAWRRICYEQLTKNPTINLQSLQSVVPPTPGHVDAGPITDTLPYFIPARVKYRKWSPTTYALLKELSFSIIAGTHVTLNSDTHPDISQLDCPHTGVGDLDFYAAKSGVLTCNLSGVNLDKVDHVTLRAATDTQTVDAAVKPANGGKVATIDLDVSKLCPLQKTAYKLYTVTSNGIEDGGTQTIHLSQEPFLTDAPNPSSIVSAAASLTLTGCHLDHLKSIELRDASYQTPFISASGQATGSASIGPISADDTNLFSKWKGDATTDKSFTLSVWLVSDTDQSNPHDSKQTVTLTKVATKRGGA